MFKLFKGGRLQIAPIEVIEETDKTITFNEKIAEGVFRNRRLKKYDYSNEFFKTEKEAKDRAIEIYQMRYDDYISKALMIKLESDQVVSNDGHLLLTPDQVVKLLQFVVAARHKNDDLQQTFEHGSTLWHRHETIDRLLDEVATVLRGE